jgi:hypothetical protein
VILLDAYALIAFLVGGPATQQVRATLRYDLISAEATPAASPTDLGSITKP